MLTKADFQVAIKDSVSLYPSLAPLYNAGDPRLLQPLEAMASMLAMLSSQIEVAMAEPFEKTRDATVLADAALRGIIRKANPVKVLISATNKSDLTGETRIERGRVLEDSSGLAYMACSEAYVPQGETRTFEAEQIRTAILGAHIVPENGSERFYSVEVPQSVDGSALCGISVTVNGEAFDYRERYVNAFSGDKVFHIETDDRQRVYIRFGYEGVVGVQPKAGDSIVLSVSYSAGDVRPAADSPFSLAIIAKNTAGQLNIAEREAAMEFKMVSVTRYGENPPPISVLRDMARYPSTYDHNAVYLGEFDFLVRRAFPSLQFLSVWNEALEESAREESALENINTLFVSCVDANSLEVFDPYSDPYVAKKINDRDLSALQKAIKEKILAADDSYKVAFYKPALLKISMAIEARVPGSYVASDVAGQIKIALVREYGKESGASKRGMNRPYRQAIYTLLKKEIPALSGGSADFSLSITESVSADKIPELWRYADESSLAVTVVTDNVVSTAWGR